MRKNALLVLSVVFGMTLVALGLPRAQESPDAQIRHGKYLVHHVAMCVQCHSPRDEQGRLIQSQLLQGGKIPFPPPYKGMAWAYHPPKLAGLPGGYSEKDLVHLLMEGVKPRGGSPRSPMPPFRMNRRDAEAVAAYLKSLE